MRTTSNVLIMVNIHLVHICFDFKSKLTLLPVVRFLLPKRVYLVFNSKTHWPLIQSKWHIGLIGGIMCTFVFGSFFLL